MFTLMLVAVAGLGVLDTVVLDTRERVHDFGVFKALGMSPRQTVAMVLSSVAGIGLVAAIGVPVGAALHTWVLPVMGSAAGTGVPKADTAVYSLPVLVVLMSGGLVIATAGALSPAGWAANARTAVALRSG
ncbi:FtsX-like permease family protein [Streptomyces carpinensis]|uniref:ABC transporter permease n=1 Tax=Streptomyces carpinensis TaxID=66369 RepID=A0ABV1W8M4_9ACTN